jgi:hypothetical protein
MSEFYSNLKILSQDLYKKSSHSTAIASAPQTSAAGGTSVLPAASTPSDRRMPLQRSGSKAGSALSLAISANAGGASGGDYFSPVSLNERIRNYVRVSNVPQEFADRYLTEDSTLQLHTTAHGDSEEKAEGTATT